MIHTTKIALVSLAVFHLAACGRQESKSIRNWKSNLNSLAGIQDYQIGAEWTKNPVTTESVSGESEIFQRTAKATAKVGLMFGGATGFAIGEKNGQVIMATNHHVIEDQSACNQARLTFALLGISSGRCDKVLATTTDLDLTIFSVKGLAAEEIQEILAVSQTFANVLPKKGAMLLTIGYGSAGNPGQRSLMATQDSDCKTFSEDGDIRFLADPDQLNPGPYKSWMFASGCDVSHGDSGSAFVDRTSGEIVGIVSTGKIPKNEKVRDAAYLRNIFDTSSEDVWSELTYVVPASKITEFLADVM